MSTDPGSLPNRAGPESDPEAIIVGEVLRAHGLRGEVVVISFSENPHRFARGARLLVGADPGRARELVVTSSRPQPPDRVLLAFSGITERTGAEALRGARIFAPPEDLPELPPGSYWERDLIGLAVLDRSGARLGSIAGVLSRLEQDLWQVVAPDGATVLLPAAKEIVLSVDLDAGQVIVDPPTGLFGEPTEP